MKSITKYSLLLLILLFVSCVRGEKDDNSYGYLTLGVTEEGLGADILVKSETSEEEQGGEEDGEQAEELVYDVTVTNASGEVKAQVSDHRTITAENPIKLLMGKYTITANNGVSGTGFNIPHWGGENSVRIYPERDASVDITCKMTKVMLTVAFPVEEEFQQMFPTYSLTIRAGEGDEAETLVFSNTATAGNGAFEDVAYFEIPANRTLTYTLHMVNADGAQYFSAPAEIKDVTSSEHYHLAFSLGDREEIDGALVLNITLDGEFHEQVVHKMNLNFDKTYMPSYDHNSEFDPDAEGIVYPLGNDITKKLTFSAPRKIKSLIVSHMDYNLILEGLPQVTDFVGISAEERSKMAQLGIVGSIAEGDVSAEIDITEFIKNLSISPENTSYKMSFTVIDTYDRYARCDFEFTIVSDIQAETGSAFTWSSFAILKGRYFSKVPPAGMTFQYRKASDENWTEIDASQIVIDQSTMTYTALVNQLELNTGYLFRSTSDKDKADNKTAAEVEFNTSGTEGTVYNLSFDEWVKDGKAWYATNDKNNNLVWDSANEGTADILGQSLVPTTPEESIIIKGKAARMESGELLGNFAAGNIYTGDFGSATISPVGAKLKWGVPFTSRPLALRGWYRYEPEAINRTSGSYSSLSGQLDFCQIQIFLTNWSEQFEISTGDNRFVDTSENNGTIIAHGQIISQDNTTDNEGNTNGYIQFTIPLVYRNMNQPTYIVISAAASRYGDYFTGGLGSTLYLDELELVYDPTELTDEEFEAVFGRIR